MNKKAMIVTTLGVIIGGVIIADMIEQKHKKKMREALKEQERLNDLEFSIDIKDMKTCETDNAKVIRFEAYLNNRAVGSVTENALDRATRIINGGI